MDKKRKNTEKVNKGTTPASPYRNVDNANRHGNAEKRKYGTRPVIRPDGRDEKNVLKFTGTYTEADKNRNIEKERKRDRQRKQRIHAGIGIAIAVILAIILTFMTPIFNITEIRLNGNDTVSKEVINEHIGDLIGSNLFGTSISKIEQKMTALPQIREVKVKKAIFPARLEIEITESQPAAYVLIGNDTLIIDSDLRIIDDSSVFDTEKLPCISGVSVSGYELNSQLEIKSDEKEKALEVMLTSLESCGLIESVKYISIDDLTAITFNYDNRIDVVCGSQLQIDRKIRMFAESIRTSTFDENSIGSVDLSVPGTAVYNP